MPYVNVCIYYKEFGDRLHVCTLSTRQSSLETKFIIYIDIERNSVFDIKCFMLFMSIPRFSGNNLLTKYLFKSPLKYFETGTSYSVTRCIYVYILVSGVPKLCSFSGVNFWIQLHWAISTPYRIWNLRLPFGN